jgi:hypothetical protein
MAVTNLTPRYLAAVRESHSPTIRGEVWFDGVRVVDSLRISGGSVVYKPNDLSRSALQGLQILDTDKTLLPDSPTALLGVYGHEIHIYRGVDFGDGTSEELLLGKFRVQNHTADEIWARSDGGDYHIDHSPTHDAATDTHDDWRYVGATVTVDGQDRAANLVDARFLTVTEPVKGNTCVDEIIRLCESEYRQLIDFDYSCLSLVTPLDKNPPATVVYQEDRAQAISDLAGAIDCRVFVTREGLLRLEPIESENPPDTLIGTERTLPAPESFTVETTRDGIYNAVVARGEAEENAYPFQGVALDVDYSGKTYWEGPFGEVPYFFNSPVLGTLQAANLAAKTRLKNLIAGRTRSYSFDVIPDPSIDPNDVLRVVLPGREAFPAVVEDVTVPLDPTALMSIKVVVSSEAPAKILE